MTLWSRISNAVRGERLNREIEEELQSHMEEAIAAGRDPRDAQRAFGSMLRQREAGHGIRVAGWLESLLYDVRFGWRQLCRNKVTSVAAVLSLALGIGSCVAAFRLIDALLWRPLPIANASNLYALSRQMIGLYGKPIEDGYWGTPNFNLMRDAVKDQTELIAISGADRTDITWSTDDAMEKAHVAYVSGNMFPVFALEPALGRLLTAADDRGPGAGPYVVLSWDYWNHRFGRDPKVLGRSLHIGDMTFEIVGVGPRDFTGTEKGTVADIFVPLSMNNFASQREAEWHRGFLMLKPGVNPAIALEPIRQHLSAVNHGFQVENSKGLHGMSQQDIDRFLNQKLVFRPAGAGISNLQKEYRRSLGILGLLAALVLLIACVNVANMMTAQAAARAQEMALRISIGAGRRRLVQLILSQSALLALFASVLGAIFAAWSAPFVLSLINPPDDPARLALSADWRVLLFGFALIIVVVLVLGLLPALRASAIRPVAALKGGEDPHSSRRLMRGAIALQVAFCFLVLFLSSLFVASFYRLQNRPLGFSTDRLLLLETVAGKGQPPVVWNQTAEALRAVPGVQSVAISHWPLLGRIAINSSDLHQRRASQFHQRLASDRFPGLALDDEDPPGFRPRLSPGRHLAGSRHRERNFRQDFLPGSGPYRALFFRMVAINPPTRLSASPPTFLTATCASPANRSTMLPSMKSATNLSPGSLTSPPSPFTPTLRTRWPSPTRFASSSRNATMAFAYRTSPRNAICSRPDHSRTPYRHACRLLCRRRAASRRHRTLRCSQLLRAAAPP